MKNWNDFVRTLAPDWLRQYWGERFLGVLSSVGNLVSEGASQALRSGLLTRGQLSGDNRALVALARSLPQYPGETEANHQERLLRAWEDWQYAGTDASVVGQLAAAGFAGAEIAVYPDRLGPHGETAPYWSQFWVRIPEASLTLVYPAWGLMRWGTFWWGYGALSENDAATFWGIVNKFKPTDWVCRGIELVT